MSENGEGKGIKDDFRQIAVVTKYELLKHLRSRKMLIFVIIAALMFSLITALFMIMDGKLPDEPKEFIESYISMVSMLIIIGVSLFCASAIASEFEERTALLMFPRPMKRTSFFIGKALACYIVCGAIICIYYALCMILSLMSTGSVYPATFGSLGLAILYMLGTGGFALLLSTMFRKGSTAIIITIFVLLLIFNIIDGMFYMFNIEPVFSITYAGADILNIIDGHVTEVVPIGGGMTITAYYPTHELAISLMIVWATVTTAISAFIFSKKEF